MNSKALLSLIAVYLAFCRASVMQVPKVGLEEARELLAVVKLENSVESMQAIIDVVMEELYVLCAITPKMGPGMDNELLARQFEEANDRLAEGSLRSAFASFSQQLGAKENESLWVAAARFSDDNEDLSDIKRSARKYFACLSILRSDYELAFDMEGDSIPSKEGLEGISERVVSKCREMSRIIAAAFEEMVPVCEIFGLPTLHLASIDGHETALGEAYESLAAVEAVNTIEHLYAVVDVATEELDRLAYVSSKVEVDNDSDRFVQQFRDGSDSLASGSMRDAFHNMAQQLDAAYEEPLSAAAARINVTHRNFPKAKRSARALLGALSRWQRTYKRIAKAAIDGIAEQAESHEASLEAHRRLVIEKCEEMTVTIATQILEIQRVCEALDLAATRYASTMNEMAAHGATWESLAAVGRGTWEHLDTTVDTVGEKLIELKDIAWRIELGENDDSLIQQFKDGSDLLVSGSMRDALYSMALQLEARGNEPLPTAAERISKNAHEDFSEIRSSARLYFRALKQWQRKYRRIANNANEAIAEQESADGALANSLGEVVEKCQEMAEAIAAQAVVMEDVCKVLGVRVSERDSSESGGLTALQKAQEDLAAIEARNTLRHLYHIADVAHEELKELAKKPRNIGLGGDNDSLVQQFKDNSDRLAHGSIKAALENISQQLGAAVSEAPSTAAARFDKTREDLDDVRSSVSEYLSCLLECQRSYKSIIEAVEEDIEDQELFEQESLEVHRRAIVKVCGEMIEAIAIQVVEMTTVCRALGVTPIPSLVGEKTALKEALEELATTEERNTLVHLDAILEVVRAELGELADIPWEMKVGGEDNAHVVQQFKDNSDCLANGRMQDAFNNMARQLDAAADEPLSAAAARIDWMHENFYDIKSSASSYHRALLMWQRKFARIAKSASDDITEQDRYDEGALEAHRRDIIEKCKEMAVTIARRVFEISKVVETLSRTSAAKRKALFSADELL